MAQGIKESRWRLYPYIADQTFDPGVPDRVHIYLCVCVCVCACMRARFWLVYLVIIFVN